MDLEVVAKTCEELWDENKVTECLAYLENLYAKGARQPQVLWRLAKACYEVAAEYPKEDKDHRNSLLVRGLELATQVLEEDKTIGAAYKWCGILLSEQYVGTKEKLANAYVIRDHFTKAIELDPNDGTAYHCLGSWCFSIAKIGWMERTVATALFGTPPTSSYEDAIKQLKESIRIAKTTNNTLLLGDVYVAMGDKNQAKIWYSEAVALPANRKAEKRNHDEAEKKLSAL